jgi:hypothetical protein
MKKTKLLLSITVAFLALPVLNSEAVTTLANATLSNTSVVEIMEKIVDDQSNLREIPDMVFVHGTEIPNNTVVERASVGVASSNFPSKWITNVSGRVLEVFSKDDFNNDGKPDVVVWREEPSSSRILVLDGQTGIQFFEGFNLDIKGMIRAGDTNDDGKINFAISYDAITDDDAHFAIIDLETSTFVWEVVEPDRTAGENLALVFDSDGYGLVVYASKYANPNHKIFLSLIDGAEIWRSTSNDLYSYGKSVPIFKPSPLNNNPYRDAVSSSFGTSPEVERKYDVLSLLGSNSNSTKIKRIDGMTAVETLFLELTNEMGIGAIETIGDIDGDGFEDVLITTLGWVNAQSAVCYSGRDASELWRFSEPNYEVFVSDDAYTGRYITLGADVNGDGQGDIFLGLKNIITGKAGPAVISRLTGELLQEDATHDLYTRITVKSFGDVNGDGQDELLTSQWAFQSGSAHWAELRVLDWFQ